jgi:hypothetical protein
MPSEADPLFINDAAPPVFFLRSRPEGDENSSSGDEYQQPEESTKEFQAISFMIDKTNTCDSYIKIKFTRLNNFKYITVEPKVFTEEQIQTVNDCELVHHLLTLPGATGNR